MPQDKVYLLIELVTDGLNPNQIRMKYDSLIRRLRTYQIKSDPVPDPLEEGAMGGDRYYKKWVAELSEADREDFESQMQERNVQVTNISQAEKENLLKKPTKPR